MSKASSPAIVRRDATPPKCARDEALVIAADALARMTDEEDAAITTAALADPDAQPRRGPGRPPSTIKKVAVSLKLDPDVVTAYRARGPGWQTRMNDDLRKAMKLN